MSFTFSTASAQLICYIVMYQNLFINFSLISIFAFLIIVNLVKYIFVFVIMVVVWNNNRNIERFEKILQPWNGYSQRGQVKHQNPVHLISTLWCKVYFLCLNILILKYYEEKNRQMSNIQYKLPSQNRISSICYFNHTILF